MTTTSKTFVKDVAESARGHWDDILASQSIIVKKNKHTTCPNCGGKDRFKYGDKNKRGDYICNQCGAGDGLTLISKVKGITIKEAAQLVAEGLGIDTEKPIKIDHEAIKKKQELQQEAEKKALSEQKIKTATIAKKLLAKCKQGESEYLEKKGLPTEGLIFNTAISGLKPPLLTIPLYLGGEVAQLQFIENPDDDGESKKRWLSGPQKNTYHLINGTNDIVFIGEGYATTLTPCLLKGFKGYVAGSANNIPAIALTAREQNPQAQIIILIDNNEAGFDANAKAHALLGDCIGIAPPDNDKKIKDWNDYFQKHGAEKTVMEIDNNLTYKHETDILPHDNSTLASQKEVVEVVSTDNDLSVSNVTANKKLKTYCDNLAGTPNENLPTKEEAALRAVEILNESYALTLSGGDDIIIKEGRDSHGKEGVTYIKRSSLKAWGGNLWLKTKANDDGKNGLLKAIDVWIQHPDRRTYDGITFIPNRQAGDYYNLWRGWEIQPHIVNEYPLIQRFLKHLLDNICDGDKDNYHYLLCWMAHLFQHPEQKPDVCLVLRSEERGTGKSKVPESLSELIGFHATKVTQSKHLIGNFNSHLGTAILVHVEESFWAGSHADAGILRDLITSHDLNIEAKGRDLVKVPSYHRFVMITNNDWAIPASRDERRFFVLDVADHQKQNRPYFKALTDDLEAGGYSQLMAFLMDYNIDLDVNQAPRTKGLENQIIESLEPHEQFWMDCLTNQTVGGIDGKEIHEVTPWKIANKHLYDEYIAYMKKQGIRSRAITSLNFGKKIGKLCPKRKDHQKDDYESKRQNAKEYPNLQICRDSFIKAMGLTDFKWED